MCRRNFNDWLDTFTESINSYTYYADFEKAYENVEPIRAELSLLNSLVGRENIEEEFETLLTNYPQCIKAIPILIAKRESEIYCQDENGAITYNFRRQEQSIEQYKYFMRETGLFDLLQNHIISNLIDYVEGVEIGLGSNGRKNRGGHQMENLVESFIRAEGVEYYKEMYLTEIENRWNYDLSSISADGTSSKRFDFVIKRGDQLYLFETNFYTGGGSKLNETARSYKMIAEECENIENVHFVWITDGKGWISAKRNLKETFDVLDEIYNIADLANGALGTLLGEE